MRTESNAPRASASATKPAAPAPRPAVAAKRTALRTTGTSGASSFTPAALSPSAPGGAMVGLARGAVNYSGSVKQLHDSLLRLNYFPPSIKSNPGFENTFGPATQAAVARLQSDHGLNATGRVDGSTAAALVNALQPPAPAKPATPPAPAPGASMVGLARGTVNFNGSVKQLHDNLLRLNYFPPSIRSNSGFGNTFGPATQAAVTAFQQDHNLPATGRVDAATAAALVSSSPRPSTPATPSPTAPTTPPSVPPASPSPASPAGPGAPTQPAPGSGVPATGVATTVDQANQSFLSQWGGTAWNSAHGAPAGYEDCGPTSCAMTLSSLGLIAHPSPANAESTIGAIRDQAFGHHTPQSHDTNDSQLVRALQANGAQTAIVRPTLSAVDNALASGHPLIVGSSSTWAAWGKQQCAQGDYLNHRNPGGHFVTVLGKATDGNYIVGDPLSRVGAIEVSKAQMQTLLGGAWNGIEVSRS